MLTPVTISVQLLECVILPGILGHGGTQGSIPVKRIVRPDGRLLACHFVQDEDAYLGHRKVSGNMLPDLPHGMSRIYGIINQEDFGDGGRVSDIGQLPVKTDLPVVLALMHSGAHLHPAHGVADFPRHDSQDRERILLNAVSLPGGTYPHQRHTKACLHGAPDDVSATGYIDNQLRCIRRFNQLAPAAATFVQFS